MLNEKARQIITTLGKLENCAIGCINTVTEVKLLGGKKNAMQGKVTKHCEGASVMFFCNSKSNAYQNMVKRRLVKEGKAPEQFQLSARAWGERIADTPFVHHKGQLYVEVIFLRKPSHTHYRLAGERIAKDQIEGLKPEPIESATAQGGLSDKVVIRTYKLNSIGTITMGEFSVV